MWLEFRGRGRVRVQIRVRVRVRFRVKVRVRVRVRIRVWVKESPATSAHDRHSTAHLRDCCRRRHRAPEEGE